MLSKVLHNGRLTAPLTNSVRVSVTSQELWVLFIVWKVSLSMASVDRVWALMASFKHFEELLSSYQVSEAAHLFDCSGHSGGIFFSFLVLSKASQYTRIFQKSLKAWGSSGLPGLQQSLKVLLKVARRPCHSKKKIMGLLDL